MGLVTMLTLVEAVANTLVSMDLVQALGVVMTGVWLTLVYVEDAILAFETRGACARKVINTIVADSSIETWLVSAVIHIDFTVFAVKALGTVAMIVIDQILALGAVLARILLAFVDVNLAILAFEARKAVALEIIDFVHAACSILTGLALFAFVDFSLAEFAGESGFAVALHAASFGFPDSVLSVAVLLAVKPDQVLVRRNSVVHTFVPIIDVSSR